ncbi:MAG: MFS transporter [Candidatus Levyibacteriota bacterium]
MLREQFLGRNPSHFTLNKVVEAFIISETFLWSAWNFVTPIFAIFVVNDIKGGNIQIAASAFSVCLISRVIFEIITGRYLNNKTDKNRLHLTTLGMAIMSVAYIGFAFSHTIPLLFLFYVLIGIGFGVASPAKYSLFTTHIDKEKSSTEWSLYDAITLIGIALATALGGFIASFYGFPFLFILSSIVNLLGIVPYLSYRR